MSALKRGVLRAADLKAVPDDRPRLTLVDLPPGARVVLASGGPVMTVKAHLFGAALCTWGESMQAFFLPELLRAAPAEVAR